ncbi:MAG: hypothetical protein ACJ790_17740 [Myxococcaceae bacterium]
MFRVFATALLLVFSATTLVACKGSCRKLSEKLCDCARNTVERDSCLRRASNEESRVPVTPEDEATCADLLPKCDCNLINTPKGKQDCGLAR